MKNPLHFSNVGIERPLEYGRETGEQFVALRVATESGIIRTIPLSEDEVIQMAEQALHALAIMKRAKH